MLCVGIPFSPLAPTPATANGSCSWPCLRYVFRQKIPCATSGSSPAAPLESDLASKRTSVGVGAGMMFSIALRLCSALFRVFTTEVSMQ